MSNEKRTILAKLHSKKHLIGWEQSESLYAYFNFGFVLISSLSSTEGVYSQVPTDEELVPGTFFHDPVNDYIVLYPYENVHPNSLIVTASIPHFFSNEPVTLPHSLTSGDQVYWEPVLSTTSSFGGAMDTIKQLSEVITGQGSIDFINDQSFWVDNYENLVFENQPIFIYVYYPERPSDKFTTLFVGNIKKKQYTPTAVRFTVADELYTLSNNVILNRMLTVEGRVGDDQSSWFQRRVYGRVNGLVPTNIDRVLDGYPIQGTVTGVPVFNEETEQFEMTFVFVGTEFLKVASPDDVIIFNNIEMTIDQVISDTEITFRDEYPTLGDFGPVSLSIQPSTPRRYYNRKWFVCGHAIKEPITLATEESTTTLLRMQSNDCFFEGDEISVETRPNIFERSVVQSLIGTNSMILRVSLARAPQPGFRIIRPSVQNVRLNQTPLRYGRDFTYTNEPSGVVLTLSNNAEANAQRPRTYPVIATFTEGSRTVTSDGDLKSLVVGQLVGLVGRTEFFEILSIDDENQLTLRTPSTFSYSETLLFKDLIIDDGSTNVSCNLLGATSDGSKTGDLLRTAPEVNRALLIDGGIPEEVLDDDSFVYASNISRFDVGVVIPESRSTTSPPVYRNVINKLNLSCFGYIRLDYNTNQISQGIIQPYKGVNTTLRMDESDIVEFKFDSFSDDILFQMEVLYDSKELDWLTQDSSKQIFVKEDQRIKNMYNVVKSKQIDTYLVTSQHSKYYSDRRVFMLSGSQGRINLRTKIDPNLIQIGDFIDLEHNKLTGRAGDKRKRRLFMVEEKMTNGFYLDIKCVDLGDSFNKVANYQEFVNNWTAATPDEKFYTGYYTDEYGLQFNDQTTFNYNKYW